MDGKGIGFAQSIIQIDCLHTLLNILPLRARGIALVQDVTCKMHSKFRGIIPLEAIIAYRI